MKGQRSPSLSSVREDLKIPAKCPNPELKDNRCPDRPVPAWTICAGTQWEQHRTNHWFPQGRALVSICCFLPEVPQRAQLTRHAVAMATQQACAEGASTHRGGTWTSELSSQGLSLAQILAAPGPPPPSSFPAGEAVVTPPPQP